MMMSVSLTFVATYFLGGVTLIPLILTIVLLHAYLTLPQHLSIAASTASFPHSIRDSEDDDLNIKTEGGLSSLTEKLKGDRHEPDVAAGYFAVCREYVPGGVNGKPPERTTPMGSVVAMESPSVYQSMYRSIFDRRQSPSLEPGKGNAKFVKKARNVFYVVLRHGHLMLYEDSEQLEVKHVISLEHHIISVCGADDQIAEGELWIKRNAIKLTRKALIKDTKSKPFFFFSENCSDKEDFYFALLQNQEIGPDTSSNPPRPQQYDAKHMIGLVQRLHSSEEQLQTRWINGLAGRLFLALYRTKDLESFMRKKITKKIARVKKPAFLSDIVLQKIDLGESAPHITNPRLKDLTIYGDCCVEADFKYNGKFRLEIAATARIDLGARFKAREVNLVLAVVIKKLNGHVMVKLKPPPSNRFWISFQTMPDMEMDIEPVVSSRQITYGIIVRAIDSRIREVLAETLVFPHWDDSPFTDTTHDNFRGGIWDLNQTSTPPEHTSIPDEAPDDEAELGKDSLVSTLPYEKDERTMSMPAMHDVASVNSHSSATAIPEVLDSGESSQVAASTSVQKNEKPPKALRTRSFAQAANPQLSMDIADLTTTESKYRQPMDAASAMIALSSQSKPTSPAAGPSDTISHSTILDEGIEKAESMSMAIPESLSARVRNLVVTESPDDPRQTSASSTPSFPNSQSFSPAIGKDSGANQAQANTMTPLASDKKPMAAIGAATAAARKWGWNVLARNEISKGQPRTGLDRAPIGRGNPIPASSNQPKRKPIPPPRFNERRQDETKPRAAPTPPLPSRRRQSSTPVGNAGEESLLIVSAPPENETPSPSDEQEKNSISLGNADSQTPKTTLDSH